MNGINHLVDYCASKFAVVGLSEALDIELKIENQEGIKTTVVCPYFVTTPLFEGINSQIVPVLTPEHVAESTVNAILTEQTVCILPSYLIALQMLKSMIPTKAFERLVYIFGMDQTMSAFDGPKTKYQ